MLLLRECKTCEFNFSGKCAGHGNAYEYGEIIVDDSVGCDSWGANFEYFTEITKNAPWYIREQLNDNKIGFASFLKLIESDENGQAIEVNIFDAIHKIYNLSLVDIALLLDVSFGVIYKARSVGVPNKRLHHFSQKLCIPMSFFQTFTTHNLQDLEKCKAEFEKQKDIAYIFQNIPDWRKRLITEITNYLQCPIHIAKEISRVDRLNWKIEIKNDLNMCEKKLVDFLVKKGEKSKQSLVAIDYKLDIGCHPSINIVSRKN